MPDKSWTLRDTLAQVNTILTFETCNKTKALILVSLETEPPKADFPEWIVQYIGPDKVIVSLGIYRYFKQFTSRMVIKFASLAQFATG